VKEEKKQKTRGNNKVIVSIVIYNVIVLVAIMYGEFRNEGV
jgi:hypothetical protein